MDHQHTNDFETQSQPDEHKQIEEDEDDDFDDAVSLCHWNQETQVLQARDPNILRPNLSKKEMLQAVMLCKNLHIESPLSNLDVEHLNKEWHIVNSQIKEWTEILPKLLRANCQGLNIWRLSDQFYSGISRSLVGIQFPHLTELSLAEICLQSLEILTWLQAPNLYRLEINNCKVTSTKLFHKTYFKKIKSIKLKDNMIQKFEGMSRMKVCLEEFACGHTKGNLVLIGVLGPGNDFKFQAKMESRNVIANMKQGLKLESEDSIHEIAAEIEGGVQGELVRRWNQKYGLMMRNCRRMLKRYEESEEAHAHAHVNAH